MLCHTPGAGPVYLQDEGQGPRATSGDTHRRIDAEVTRMLREAYSRVTSLLVGLHPHTVDLGIGRRVLTCNAVIATHQVFLPRLTSYHIISYNIT